MTNLEWVTVLGRLGTDLYLESLKYEVCLKEVKHKSFAINLGH